MKKIELSPRELVTWAAWQGAIWFALGAVFGAIVASLLLVGWR